MRTVIAGILLILAACDGGPTDVSGTCTAYVFANDVTYVPIDEFVDGPTVSADPYFTVTRYDPECRDQGGRHDPIYGESNFLPVGTAVHAVEGFASLEKLAYWDENWLSWRVLIPPPSCDPKESAAGVAASVSLEPPCGG